MTLPDIVSSFSATATGTNAGATATKSGAANKRYAVTHISGRSDAATQLQILGGANGTTVVYQLAVAANVPFAVSGTHIAPLHLGSVGQNVSVKLVASTAGCEVNISGLELSSV